MDCSPPGPSVYAISQTRIPKWVAMSFFRGSSQPEMESMSPELAGGFVTAEPPGKLKRLQESINNYNDFWFNKYIQTMLPNFLKRKNSHFFSRWRIWFQNQWFLNKVRKTKYILPSSKWICFEKDNLLKFQQNQVTINVSFNWPNC